MRCESFANYLGLGSTRFLVTGLCQALAPEAQPHSATKALCIPSLSRNRDESLNESACQAQAKGNLERAMEPERSSSEQPSINAT